MCGSAPSRECDGTHFTFSWIQSCNTTNFPNQTFQQANPYQEHAAELSSWPGPSDRGLRSLDSLALPTAECQSRWSISKTLRGEPYFSQPSALPHRPCATQDWFPGPPRKQAFCKKKKKRPLLYLKLWGKGWHLGPCRC